MKLKKLLSSLLAALLCFGMFNSPALYSVAMEEDNNEEIYEIEENESSLISVNEPIIVKSSGHNTMNDALAISTNKTISDNLPKYNTKNWYAFTLAKDGYIDITFSHPYIDSSNSYWYLKVYDDKEKEILSFFYNGNEKDAKVSDKCGLGKGTYYIKITEGSTHSSESYSFIVGYEASSAWEKEFNENIASPTKIGVNTEINGNLRAYNDKDFYEFTLDKDGYINITFSHPYIDSSNSYWYLKVYDDKEKEILSFFYNGNEKDAKLSDKCGLGKGTYYIKITEGSTHSSENYSFIVGYEASSAWEKEFNENIASPTKIEVNTEIFGNLRAYNDKDYYEFTTPEDGYIRVTFSHPYIDSRNSYWYMKVYDKNEKEILSYFYNGNEKDAIIADKCGLGKGTYYIKITEGSTHSPLNYSFKVSFFNENGCWYEENGKYYWYEHGDRQGTYDDLKGVMGTDPQTCVATNRGREICDVSLKDDAGQIGVWFWLDSVYDGAKAVGKEVWMPYIYQDEAKWDDATKASIAAESDYGMEGMGGCVLYAINNKAGKWVRYDNNGRMLKGWVTIEGDLEKAYPDQKGNTYYYDTRTGLMAKGKVKIDGKEYEFDGITGALIK